MSFMTEGSLFVGGILINQKFNGRLHRNVKF